MLEFFATSGDFTRRLTSIKANRKFSSPLSGPEDFYSVSIVVTQDPSKQIIPGAVGMAPSSV